MEEEQNKYLIYINYVGLTQDGFKYEFLYSNTPEIVWGDNWNVQSAAACGNMLPVESTYSSKQVVYSNYELHLVQDNTCFSMQDCIDGCVCLMWFEADEQIITIKFAEEETIVGKIIEQYFSISDE